MVGRFAISALALASAASAVNPVTVKGSNFVDQSGQRFDVVGVAYQPGGSAGFNPGSNLDPLSDSKQCLRDAAIMQKLGVNTIRVYNLDPDVSHDECAGIFDAAGIYMIIDVNSPLQGQSINAAEPWTTYTKDYLQRVFQVIEAFKGYPNLIGFFSGNEIINDVNSGKIDPPYIRAVTRDMKNYIAKQSPNRAIPVGYSAADVREILVDTSSYLQCQLDGDSTGASKIDFFGLNSYSWCGDSSIQKAGYDVLIKDFQSTTVPVFFSEYGCNAVTPRPFTEVGAIYGPQMRSVFSGGIAYEYTQETNNFGLVKIGSNGDSAQLLQDYDNLQGQLAKLDKSSLTQSNGTAQAAQAPKCDASLITTSGFNNNFTLPAVPEGVQDMIDNGVTSGFKGGKQVVAPTSTACPVPVTDSKNQPVQGLGITVVPSNSTTTLSNSTTAAKNNGGAQFAQQSTNVTYSGNQTAPGAGSAATNVPPAPPATGSSGSGSGSSTSSGSSSSSSSSSTTGKSSALPSSAAAASGAVLSPLGIMAAVAGMLVL